jgi:hypothetical protein
MSLFSKLNRPLFLKDEEFAEVEQFLKERPVMMPN